MVAVLLQGDGELQLLQHDVDMDGGISGIEHPWVTRQGIDHFASVQIIVCAAIPAIAICFHQVSYRPVLVGHRQASTFIKAFKGNVTSLGPCQPILTFLQDRLNAIKIGTEKISDTLPGLLLIAFFLLDVVAIHQLVEHQLPVGYHFDVRHGRMHARFLLQFGLPGFKEIEVVGHLHF